MRGSKQYHYQRLARFKIRCRGHSAFQHIPCIKTGQNHHPMNAMLFSSTSCGSTFGATLSTESKLYSVSIEHFERMFYEGSYRQNMAFKLVVTAVIRSLPESVQENNCTMNTLCLLRRSAWSISTASQACLNSCQEAASHGTISPASLYMQSLHHLITPPFGCYAFIVAT